jgi:hypothetical protein
LLPPDVRDGLSADHLTWSILDAVDQLDLGPFALADAGQLVELVEAAGFTDVETGTVTATYQTGSPELATRWLRDVAPPISSLVDSRPPEVQGAHVGQGHPGVGAVHHRRRPRPAREPSGLGDRDETDAVPLAGCESGLKQTRAHASSTKAERSIAWPAGCRRLRIR